MKKRSRWKMAAMFALAALVNIGASAQSISDKNDKAKTERRIDRRSGVRSVTIPVTIRLPESSAQKEELQQLDLTVLEDGEKEELLSARGADRAPLALEVLIQDDVVSSISNEIKGIASFIRHLPPGSRVLVGYLRSGSVQIRQRFTTDLERAAKALRIPVGSSVAAPFNPYEQTVEALKRFEALPAGRRAALVISDGLDISRGLDSSSPTQSIDLQRAINDAQRRSVAIYSIYAPTGSTSRSSILVGNAQGSLARLAQETGGKAFFQGTGAPVSFDPFLKELATTLDRQFALTYLSTHADKGFHQIKIQSAQSHIDIAHPAGYVNK